MPRVPWRLPHRLCSRDALVGGRNKLQAQPLLERRRRLRRLQVELDSPDELEKRLEIGGKGGMSYEVRRSLAGARYELLNVLRQYVSCQP